VVSLLTWNLVDTLYKALAAQAPAAFVPLADPVPQAAGGVSGTPKPATLDPQDAALADENKWVATRSRLRTLGQQLSAWLADQGAAVDATTLDVDRIGTALDLEADATTDGWGQTIRYESDGAGYRLISSGPDGLVGTPDDIDYRRSLKP